MCDTRVCVFSRAKIKLCLIQMKAPRATVLTDVKSANHLFASSLKNLITCHAEHTLGRVNEFFACRMMSNHLIISHVNEWKKRRDDDDEMRRFTFTSWCLRLDSSTRLISRVKLDLPFFFLTERQDEAQLEVKDAKVSACFDLLKLDKVMFY